MTTAMIWKYYSKGIFTCLYERMVVDSEVNLGSLDLDRVFILTNDAR